MGMTVQQVLELEQLVGRLDNLRFEEGVYAVGSGRPAGHYPSEVDFVRVQISRLLHEERMRAIRAEMGRATV